MSKNYVIAFPRIGEKRELKIALELYWSGESSYETLKNEALLNAKLAYESQLTEIENEQQELRNKQKQEADAKQIKLDKAVADARIQLADAVGGALNGLSAIAGENAGIQKAIGIAQATIDTFIGANKALAQGGIVGGIAAAGIIATGLANVSTILSTPIPNAKGGQVNVGASQINASRPQAPSFNIVGDSGTNQIATALGENQNTPTRAYVVSRDITTAQELDRNIESEASIGE